MSLQSLMCESVGFAMPDLFIATLLTSLIVSTFVKISTEVATF